MLGFIVRRLLSGVVVLFGVVLLVFILARVIPGDPCIAAYGEKATPELCAAFADRYGLNEPFHVQLGIYLGVLSRDGALTSADGGLNVLPQFLGGGTNGLLHGDLDNSIRFGRPVVDIVVERLPVTVELTLFALLFAVSIGIPLGIVSALRRNSPIDVASMAGANLGVSTPVFVLGLFLQIIFAVALRGTVLALPPSGRLSAGGVPPSIDQAWGLAGVDGALGSLFTFFSNMYIVNAIATLNGDLLIDAVRHLILPAVAVGTIPLAIIARITRSSLLEVMGLDYIRTARAKGLRERIVVVRHGLRTALLPVVTVIGLSIGAFLSGAVLTETIFNLTGIGKTILDAVNGRDYIMIQGITLLVAIAYVLVNLLVDISYALLDPRVRVS
ncbi:MAG TPA: ABC transporter permease [Candidatus Limnocylindrales bacterium]|nr:ABC transporter permease [Candidatus Limnocylindrales bacterium]